MSPLFSAVRPVLRRFFATVIVASLVSSLSIAAPMAPVGAAITVQETEGVTEADLTVEGLKNLEEWTKAVWTRKVKLSYQERGGDPAKFNMRVTSSSVIVRAQGRRLAVIRLTAVLKDQGETFRFVHVLGFTPQGAVRVSCWRTSDHDIPIWSGECGKKMKEAYGVSLK